MENLHTINQATLKALSEAGAIRYATLIAGEDGFGVIVKYGMLEKQLITKRGNRRYFNSLDTAFGYLKRIGIPRFEVDASGLSRVAS